MPDLDADTPGLLRLPFEVRCLILLDVLSAGVHKLGPDYAYAVYGFPLYDCNRVNPNHLKEQDRIPIDGLLFSCKTLQHDCLTLLAEQFSFIVHVDVRADAQSGANAFEQVHALNAAFRHKVQRITLILSFLPSHPPRGFEWDKFHTMLDSEQSPLMFEKIVENVVELMHLMPAVQHLHLVWNMYFGNQGLAMVNERYTRQLWRRLEKEVPSRAVNWTAQHCIGFFKTERERSP